MNADDLKRNARATVGKIARSAQDPEVRESTKARLAPHWASAKAAWDAMPKLAWLAPVLFIFVIAIISVTPLSWLTEKWVQEIASPMAIGIAAGLALFAHRWIGEQFTAMLAIFTCALFVRELNIPFSNLGFYIAFILLALWFSNNRSDMQEWFSERWIRVFLGGAVWTYLVAKFLDWALMIFFDSSSGWFERVEECLETCGHLLTLALVVATLKIGLMDQARVQARRELQKDENGGQ